MHDKNLKRINMTKNDNTDDKTIINKKERNSCPKCGSVRVIKRSGYYGCRKCGWKGNSPKKVMWYFGIPYREEGPSVGRTISPSVRIGISAQIVIV